jgi:hypothetical protein
MTSSNGSSAGRIRLSRHLALATVAYAIAFYAIAPMFKPGYSSASQYISEFNATGTPLALELGLLGFLPLALLFAAFLVAARPHAQVRGASLAGWWLLWSQPVAFLGALAFPCDLGCRSGGSLTQDIHDLLGLVTYLAGALGLFLLSYAPPVQGPYSLPRTTLRVAAIGFVLLFLLMLDMGMAQSRGILQRTADALLGMALLVVAWQIVRPRG